MPTLMKKYGNAWQARVYADGKQIASKMFPPGKKGGPEWRAAKEWEEEQKRRHLAGMKTLSDSERLLKWGTEFLKDTEKRTSPKDLQEKTRIMKIFFAYCHKAGINRLEDISPAKARAFLSGIYDERGPKVANKFRQRLMTAWNFGIEGIDGLEDFPQGPSPFKKTKKFPAEENPRYVPPEEDMIAVMQQAKGQDLVMLMLFYYTGARAGEVFRLKWSDIDFPGNKVCLRDKKTGGKGGWRERWLPMHSELSKALEWWRAARPCIVDHVFFQVHCHEKMGEPFTHRSHYMPAVCKRLGIKVFTFHSIRHKSAAITFLANGLHDAQILMGHYRPTTTDIYVRSAGLYASKDGIPAALANSAIGQAADSLFSEMEMPLDGLDQEAFCKPALVN